MIEYIVGGILIAFITVFYEIRIGVKRTEIESLKDKMENLIEATDNILTMSDDFKELIDDHLILLEILEENIDEEKIDELFIKKKKFKNTEDLNNLIEEIMRNEG